MKRFLTALAALFLVGNPVPAAEIDPADWEAVLEKASGETVYWNAWGGSENINAYIDWVGDELRERYGVKLVHVKLDDTANAVTAVLTEKAAGKDANGSIDLIWINGENFASMKQQGLLYGPGWGGETAELAICRCREQADHHHRLHHTDRRHGIALGHGQARLLLRQRAHRSGRLARFRR